MINKITPSQPIRTTLKADKKKNDTMHTTRSSNDSSIYTKVAASVSKKDRQNAHTLRQKLILATLAHAFGDKSANEPMFKHLCDKIERTLACSDLTESQLIQALKQLEKKS
jgi:RNase P protein component